MKLFILLFSISAFAKTPQVFKIDGYNVKTEIIKKELGIPWGFDFMPEGKVVLTDRVGKMRVLDLNTKKIIEVKGLPKIRSKGQGGLLDVRYKDGWVYFTYSAEYSDGIGTILAKGRIEKDRLVDQKILFRSNPPGSGGVHFGSRIVFGKNGTLFFGVGDRGERNEAQDLKLPNGKLFRINEDGSIPKDNPFVKNKKAIDAIWSYGHRNPQGMAIHPETGALWEQEHGPRGGDEINFIKKGANYGWPIITYGKEYWGPSIGDTHKKGMEQPVKYFVPSIAPSSLMIYSGKMFKKWKGHFFSGALKLKHINKVVIEGKKAIGETRFLEDWGRRIRCLREGPGGEIYFTTDYGELAKLTL